MYSSVSAVVLFTCFIIEFYSAQGCESATVYTFNPAWGRLLLLPETPG